MDVWLIVEAPQGNRTLGTERVTESNININTYRNYCAPILCYIASSISFTISPLILMQNYKVATTFAMCQCNKPQLGYITGPNQFSNT